MSKKPIQEQSQSEIEKENNELNDAYRYACENFD